jgi:DNA polymerase-4
MDRVRERFGRGAIGYTSVSLSEARSVPDEFRALAEHDL